MRLPVRFWLFGKRNTNSSLTMRNVVGQRKKSRLGADVGKTHSEPWRAKTRIDFTETIREFHRALPERRGDEFEFMSEEDKKIYERSN